MMTDWWESHRRQLPFILPRGQRILGTVFPLTLGRGIRLLFVFLRHCRDHETRLPTLRRGGVAARSSVCPLIPSGFLPHRRQNPVMWAGVTEQARAFKMAACQGGRSVQLFLYVGSPPQRPSPAVDGSNPGDPWRVSREDAIKRSSVAEEK